jgi:hypothetical protein
LKYHAGSRRPLRAGLFITLYTCTSLYWLAFNLLIHFSDRGDPLGLAAPGGGMILFNAMKFRPAVEGNKPYKPAYMPISRVADCSIIGEISDI